MTPDQQRSAITGVCGWKPEVDERASTEKYKTYTQPPNYPNDLNAMHEAEKVLTERQRGVYVDLLKRFGISEFGSHTSTAAQRAEAFLKTLNLWKPSPNNTHGQ